MKTRNVHVLERMRNVSYRYRNRIWYVGAWPRYGNIRMKKWTCLFATRSRSVVRPQNMPLPHNNTYSVSRWRAEFHCFPSVKYLSVCVITCCLGQVISEIYVTSAVYTVGQCFVWYLYTYLYPF